MEPQGYLIDSNVIIDFLGGRLPEEGATLLNKIVNAKFCVSIISKIEVLGYKLSPEHEQKIRGFIDLSVVMPLNDVVAEEVILIRKNKRIKVPDAIIAATELVNKLALVTRNTSDFLSIDGLSLINPHELKGQNL